MALSVRGLTRRYGSHLALAPLDLELRPGASLGLLGRNGAGKSTLLGLCAGRLVPTAGEVLLDGRSAREAAARARLGVLPERAALPGDARLGDLLAARDPRDPSALLDELGIRAWAWTPIRALSSGLRQRAALAVALHGDPGLLLLDEPLTALDPEAVERVVGAVGRRVAAGCTLVLATHRPEAWLGVVEELAALDAGRFARLGPAAEVARRVTRAGLASDGRALAPADPGDLVAVRAGWSALAGAEPAGSPARAGRERGVFELAVREIAGAGAPGAVVVASGLLAVGIPFARATSMGAPSRAALELALWWAWMVGCGLAMAVGSRAVAGPLADRTATWRLTGPVGRGRWAAERVGAASLVAGACVVALHGAAFALLGGPPPGAGAMVAFAVAEAVLLVGLAALLGAVYRPLGALAAVGALWLVGHLAGAWSEALALEGWGGFAGFVLALLPDLDLLDAHARVVSGGAVDPGRVALALGWAACWAVACLAATAAVLDRRDV